MCGKYRLKSADLVSSKQLVCHSWEMDSFMVILRPWEAYLGGLLWNLLQESGASGRHRLQQLNPERVFMDPYPKPEILFFHLFQEIGTQQSCILRQE